MKRIFLTIMLLMAFVMVGFSQTGVYYGGVGNRTLRETGLILRPEIGGALYDARSGFFSFSTGVNLGYQVVPHIYVGGGMFFCVEPESGYDSNTGIFGYNNMESLYTSVRWYCLDRRSSPFLELDLGIGRFDFTHDYYEYYYGYYNYYDPERFFPFLNVAIGYDIKNYDIKLGLGNFGYNGKELAVFVTFGYNFLMKR